MPNLSTADAIYLGSTPVTAVHVGATKVWPLGFDPLSVAGCQLWLDAADASTITHSGGAVSQWDDKSGNTRHTTQGTAGRKPTTGTATIGGRNVLVFDGGDVLLTPTLTLAQPVTIYVVARLTNTGVGNGQMIGNTGNSPTIYAGNAITNYWRLYAGKDVPSAVVTDSTAHQFTAIFNGVSSFLYLDGTAILSNVNPGTPGWSSKAIPIGAGPTASVGWPGEVAEVLIYDTALGTTDRQAIESYLATKWGL